MNSNAQHKTYYLKSLRCSLASGTISKLFQVLILIKHFTSCGVPMALSSNSSRSDIESKISYHIELKDSFSVIIGGDEVKNVKPSPEIFLEAAKRMNTDPSSCLVVEDSIPGVIAGKAAGMQVLAVPSYREKVKLFSSADEVINSLLDFSPGRWGLPPFSDWIEETLPTKPWFIRGPVIKGFGRGSKLLGIPTANLPVDNFPDEISEMSSGVYFGWASLSNRGIYKMVMSVGWNPYFDNTEKTMEPWLLHEFEEDFYGENPIQVLVNAVANSGPREDSTRIGSAGVARRQAVDVSPLRRVNQGVYLITSGARDSAFRGIKSIAECLADEIIAAAANDNQKSHAVRKKDEIERVAKANR